MHKGNDIIIPRKLRKMSHAMYRYNSRLRYYNILVGNKHFLRRRSFYAYSKYINGLRMYSSEHDHGAYSNSRLRRFMRSSSRGRRKRHFRRRFRGSVR